MLEMPDSAASALLLGRLPAGEAEATALLAGAGLVPAALDLAGLTRLFRAGGGEAPFQIVRCGGMAIAVAKGQRNVAGQIGSIAIRMVRYRGLASVRGVADRASALVSSPVTEDAARRLLAAMPRVRWLDGGERRRWFSLDGDTGRFEIALRKIFAVAREVPFDELCAALGRALAGAYEAPRHAIERCLVDMGRCQIGDGVVRRVEPDAATALTPQERTLVALVDAAGGVLDAPALRRGALAGGVAKTTVNQLLRLSPLFVPVASGAPVPPSAFRLVGSRPAVI